MAAKKDSKGVAQQAQDSIFNRSTRMRIQNARSVTRAEQQMAKVQSKLADETERLREEEEALVDAQQDFLKFAKQEVTAHTNVTTALVKQLKVRKLIADETERETKVSRDLAKKSVQRIKDEVMGRNRAMRSAQEYQRVTRSVHNTVEELGQQLSWQNLALRAADRAWYQARRGMMGAMQTMQQLPRTIDDARTSMVGIEREMVAVAAATHSLASEYHVDVTELGRSQDTFLRRFNRSRAQMQNIIQGVSREALEAQATMGVDVEDTMGFAAERMQAGQSYAQIQRQLRTLRYVSEVMLEGSRASRGTPDQTNYFFNNRSEMYRRTVEIARNTKVQHVDLLRMSVLMANSGKILEEMGETQQDALEASEKLLHHFMDVQNAPDVIKHLTGGRLGSQMQRELREAEASQDPAERTRRISEFQHRYGIDQQSEGARAGLMQRVRDYNGGYGDRRWMHSTFGATAPGVHLTANQYGEWMRSGGRDARGSVLQGFIPGLRDNQAEDLAGMLARGEVGGEQELQRLMTEAQRRADAGAAGGGTGEVARVQNAAELGLMENLNRFLDNNMGIAVALAAIGASVEVLPRILEAIRAARAGAQVGGAAAGINAGTAATTTAAEQAAVQAAEQAAGRGAPQSLLGRVGSWARGVPGRMGSWARTYGGVGRFSAGPMSLLGAGIAAHDVYSRWNSRAGVGENLLNSDLSLSALEGIGAFTGVGALPTLAAGEIGRYASSQINAADADRIDASRSREGNVGFENMQNLGSWRFDPAVAAFLQTPQGQTALANYRQGRPSAQSAEVFKRAVQRMMSSRGGTTTPTSPRNAGGAPTPSAPPTLRSGGGQSGTNQGPFASAGGPNNTDILRGTGTMERMNNGDGRLIITVAGLDRTIAQSNAANSSLVAAGV